MISAAIFVSGEGTNAENLFTRFAGHSKLRIKLVVTNREKAGVISRAMKHRKPVHIVTRFALENYPEPVIEYLKSEKIGLIILAGWLLKLPEAFIEAFPERIINLHPALLPNHGGKGMYGTNVHKSVIDAGDKESGVTIHYVNEEYDRGDIILQAKCPVLSGDTPESLEQRVRALEYEYFPIAVESVAEKLDAL